MLGLRLAASLLTILAVQQDSPLWVPAIAFSIYAPTLMAASIPTTNAIMNTAAPGEEGSASAFRAAASHIGNALGVVYTMSILVTVAPVSLTSSLTADDLASAHSPEVVRDILNGATSEEAASLYSVPADQVQTIDADVVAAMVDGLHAVVVSGAFISLLCAARFHVALRRQERSQVRVSTA